MKIFVPFSALNFWLLFLLILATEACVSAPAPTPGALAPETGGWLQGGAEATAISPIGSNGAAARSLGAVSGSNTTAVLPVGIAETEMLSEEFKEAARNLGRDGSGKIAEYAKRYLLQNFDYVPYYGFLKGPDRTFDDRAGSDLDLVCMLKTMIENSGIPAGEFSPAIIEGVRTMSAADGAKMLGIREISNGYMFDDLAVTVCSVLSNGSIPNEMDGTAVSMKAFWLRITIAGVTTDIDPAEQCSQVSTPIDALNPKMQEVANGINSTLGYNRGSFLAAIGSQGSATEAWGGADSVLITELSRMTENLRTHLKANHFKDSPEYLTGIPVRQHTVPQFIRVLTASWTAVPESVVHFVSFNHRNINYSMPVAHLGNRQVRFKPTYVPDNVSPPVPAIPVSPLPATRTSHIEPTYEFVPRQVYPPGSNTLVNKSVYTVDAGMLPQGWGGLVWEGGSGFAFGTGTGGPSFKPFANSGSWRRSNSSSYTSNSGVVSAVNDPLAPGPIQIKLQGFRDTSPGPPSTLFSYIYENQQGWAPGYHSNIYPDAIRLFTITPDGWSMGQYSHVIRAKHDITPYVFSNSESYEKYFEFKFTIPGPKNPFQLSRYDAGSGAAPILFGGTKDLNVDFNFRSGEINPNCQLTLLSATLADLPGRSDSARFSVLSRDTAAKSPSGTSRVVVRYTGSQPGDHAVFLKTKWRYGSIEFDWNESAVVYGYTAPRPTRAYAATLNVGSQVVATTGEFPPDTSGPVLSISVNHPYAANSGAFADQSAAYPVQYNSNYVIASGFGTSHKGKRMERLNADLEQLTAINPSPADPTAQLLKTMELIGETWMVETDQSRRLLGGLFGKTEIIHHRFGLVGQEQGVFIDVKQQFSAESARRPQSGDTHSMRRVDQIIGSALESGVLEQLQNKSDKSGVSTVRLMKWATQPGDGGAGTARRLTFVTNANGTTISPKPASLTSPGGVWTGGGYMSESTANGVLSTHMSIGGQYNGGYAGWNGDAVADFATSAASSWSTMAALAYGMNPRAGDPVDLVTGQFVYDHTDFTIGSGKAPGGISLHRRYNGGDQWRKTSLGYGWSHNWDSSVVESSTSSLHFAGRTALDSSAMLTAMIVMADLTNLSFPMPASEDTSKRMLAAFLVGDWAVNQINGSAISVKSAGVVQTYTKLPNGAYVAPPGTSSVLSLAGGIYSLGERNGTVTTFNASKKLASITDVDSNALSVVYNASGKVWKVTDAYNRVMTFNYTGDKLTSVSDEFGRAVGYSQPSTNLVSYTDPDGNVFKFIYGTDANYDIHKIIELRDHDDRVITRNFHDGGSRVRRQWSMGDSAREWKYYFGLSESTEKDPLGGTRRFVYDNLGRTITNFDALGRRTDNYYDAQNQVVETILPDDSSSYLYYDNDLNLLETWLFDLEENWSLLAEMQYDSLFRLKKQWDANSNLTQYEYKGVTFHVSKITNALNEETTFEFDARGRLEWQKDAQLYKTSYAYDAWGNVNRSTAPDNTFSEFEYFGWGPRKKVTDALGQKTNYLYNNQGQVREITDELLGVQTFEYDRLGNLKKSISPRKKRLVPTDRITTNTHQYDQLGHLVWSKDALSRETKVDYDLRDWEKFTTFIPDGRKVTMTKDAAGQLREALEEWASPLPGGGFQQNARTTLTTPDIMGRPLTTTNALLETVTNDYDERGRLESTTSIQGETVLTEYDDNGNVEKTTTPAGAYTNTIIDGLNRVREVQSPTGRTLATSYNTRGLMDGMTKPSGEEVGFTYDAKGRRETLTDNTGEITYGYNDNDMLTSVTEAGKTCSREYDELNRLEKFTDPYGKEMGYQYYPDGLLWKLTYPGSKVVEYTYYDDGKLYKVKDWAGRETIFNYDAAGRLSEQIRHNGTKRLTLYDAAGRLLQVKEVKADGTPIYLSYATFDLADKRTTENRAPGFPNENQPPASLEYDSENQLTSVTGGGMGTGVPAYDLNGNMTYGPLPAGGTWVSYAWNGRGQMLSAGATTHEYSPEGNRIAVTTGGVRTDYLVAPSGSSTEVFQTRTASGNRLYIYGNGLLYDVSDDAADTPRYYHYDTFGSTFALSSAAAVVTGRNSYLPYGKRLQAGAVLDTPFLFAGKYGIITDSNELLLMRARFYHTGLARFFSEDPAGFAGGYNLYAYVSGNPIGFLDPLGLWGWRDVVSMTVDFLPVAGSIKSVIEVVAGKDLITGEPVNRAMAAAGIAAGLIPGAKALIKGGSEMVEFAAKHGDEVLDAAKAASGVADDAGRYLYRTISPGDPHFSQFSKIGDVGVIRPRGGHNDLTRHVQLDETDSIFTSWSKDGPANWKTWSKPGYIQLRVDTHTLQNPALDVSRWSNFPWEQEVSVIGKIRGAVRVK